VSAPSNVVQTSKDPVDLLTEAAKMYHFAGKRSDADINEVYAENTNYGKE
jgi:hypothetical protein